MARIFHPLLIMLAGCTEKELARQVQYLKEENKILRSKLPRRITVTPAERQSLLKFGKPVGKAIKELITIVTPRTFARWVSAEKGQTPTTANRRTGRLRTPDEIRDLILKLARETGWGYTKILGALRKMGIRSVSRQTVKNILKEHGFDPGPKRGKGTWDEFLKIHAATLWQCDFFTKKVWTLGGLVEMYMLVFTNVGSRRVWVSSPTAHPDGRWVAQHARNVCMEFAEEEKKPTYVTGNISLPLLLRFSMSRCAWAAKLSGYTSPMWSRSFGLKPLAQLIRGLSHHLSRPPQDHPVSKQQFIAQDHCGWIRLVWFTIWIGYDCFLPQESPDF